MAACSTIGKIIATDKWNLNPTKSIFCLYATLNKALDTLLNAIFYEFPWIQVPAIGFRNDLQNLSDGSETISNKSGDAYDMALK